MWARRHRREDSTAGQFAGVASTGQRGITEPMIREELLSLLVCPMGKAPLRLEDQTLVCTRCGLRFDVKDDIPNMLAEEATLPEGCHGLADLPCVKAGDARVDPA